MKEEATPSSQTTFGVSLKEYKKEVHQKQSSSREIYSLSKYNLEVSTCCAEHVKGYGHSNTSRVFLEKYQIRVTEVTGNERPSSYKDLSARYYKSSDRYK